MTALSTAPTQPQRQRPFSPFEWMVAGRYLRARRKDAFISVIAALTIAGIAIGVATLITVMSVMNGFREELLTKILGLNGHFTALPLDQKFSDYGQVVLDFESVAGVEHAVAYVEGQTLASGATESTGVTVRGVDFASIQKLELLEGAAEQGGWDAWDESDGVAIGYRLAQQLGLGIGDPITIINPNGAVTPFGKTPQIRSYPVNVIFNLGMVEFDSYFLYMPLAASQDYFKLYEDVLKPGQAPLDPMATDEEIDAAYTRVPQATAIEVFVDDPDAVDAMRNTLQASIDRPMILYDWQERNQTFFEALQVERVVMFVILSMIILVAAFNIISSLVMLVKDKARDIAVMRTMGATRGSIMRIFSMTGTAIGVAGTLIGLVLGLLLATYAEPLRSFVSDLIGVRIFPPEVFFLSKLPSKINPTEIAIVVSMSLGLSFLATLYPAWRAAQYDPVEALRYE
ncbi:MAG: lipoprotein-releasing system transrane subunit LolC [Devosia sp.]|nr:lipoprotein-releasing system transrane subunit LolC [Devosia sp.]